MSISTANPTPCLNFLANIAAEAQQVSGPISPYPLFFPQPQCPQSAAFPSNVFSVDCANNVNCLTVISGSEWNNIQSGKSPIQSNQVNIFRSSSNPQGNVFSSADDLLRALYIPPGYHMYFLETNPSGRSDFLRTISHLHIPSGSLYSDVCLANLSLGNGTAILNKCSTYNVHYFIVIQEETFEELIQDMCVNNRLVELGSGNSLNRVWTPSSSGCDDRMSKFCHQVNTQSLEEYQDICACFIQQEKLNNQFGKEKRVPVCCFGEYVEPDIHRACILNKKAYKTQNMLNNCCTVALCQKAWQTNDNLQRHIEHAPTCQGNVVPDLQKEAINPSSEPEDEDPVKKSFRDTKQVIPMYVWMVVAGAVLCLIVFLILLAFVNTRKKAPLPKTAKSQPNAF